MKNIVMVFCLLLIYQYGYTDDNIIDNCEKQCPSKGVESKQINAEIQTPFVSLKGEYNKTVDLGIHFSDQKVETYESCMRKCKHEALTEDVCKGVVNNFSEKANCITKLNQARDGNYQIKSSPEVKNQ